MTYWHDSRSCVLTLFIANCRIKVCHIHYNLRDWNGWDSFSTFFSLRNCWTWHVYIWLSIVWNGIKTCDWYLVDSDTTDWRNLELKMPHSTLNSKKCIFLHMPYIVVLYTDNGICTFERFIIKPMSYCFHLILSLMF